MNIWRRLYQFVRPYRSAVIFSFVLLALAGLFEILTTALVIPLFDNVLIIGQSSPNDALQKVGLFQQLMRFLMSGLSLIPGSNITQLAVALVLFTLLKGVCLYNSNYSMSRVGQSVVTDLRVKLFDHILNQSMAFFSLNSTGRLMSRMGSDTEQLQEAVSTSLAELFRESVLLFSLIVWNFLIDWKLALLALLIAPFALLLTLTMGKRIRSVSVKGREDTATLNDQLQQSITGMRIIKAFGMEKHEGERFRTSSFRLFRSNMKAAAILFLNSPVMEFLGVLAFVPLLYYAHVRIVEGTLTLGLFGGSLFSLFRMA